MSVVTKYDHFRVGSCQRLIHSFIYVTKRLTIASGRCELLQDRYQLPVPEHQSPVFPCLGGYDESR